ncbi:MAG: TetR family transcriptional regulator [Candidatus Binatia bacterium]
MSTRAALKRDERKAATRRALIGAAAELFARRGIEATSLDEIAAEVGLTKGAVYAHFESKADLVMHVLDSTQAAVEGNQLVDPGRRFGDALAELGPEVADMLPRITRDQVMLFLETFLYELRDEDRRRKFVRGVRKGRKEGGAELDTAARERGRDLLVPGRELMAIFEGIGVGLLVMLAFDAEAISRDSIVRFFGALGYGLDDADAVNALLSKPPSRG